MEALRAFHELVTGLEASRAWQNHTFRFICKAPGPDAQPMELLSARIQSEVAQPPEGSGVSESKEEHIIPESSAHASFLLGGRMS